MCIQKQKGQIERQIDRQTDLSLLGLVGVWGKTCHFIMQRVSLMKKFSLPIQIKHQSTSTGLESCLAHSEVVTCSSLTASIHQRSYYKGNDRNYIYIYMIAYTHKYMCVCERDRQTDRERGRETRKRIKYVNLFPTRTKVSGVFYLLSFFFSFFFLSFSLKNTHIHTYILCFSIWLLETNRKWVSMGSM